MKTIYIVFRSRTHSTLFSEKCSNRGIRATLTNTPREVGAGCGLSVKFAAACFAQIRNIAKETNYSSFVGYYTVERGVASKY